MKKDNPRLKKRLKFWGFMCLFIGLTCLIIGLVDFFSAWGTFEMPKYPWLDFVALPLIFSGLVMIAFGYMRQYASPSSSQVDPFKDTNNYLFDGSKNEDASIKCPFCGESNDHDATYCDYCGKKLKKTCTCGEVNDPDSRYCKRCGRSI
ncbi:MAG: zinc ribbon domain-containing protein [Acholeplasmataceae bacterium]|jgi:hypothetical protein|nr:zinc ribbon domain-containing protein [Acholeplasmataceae bacterium]